MSVIINGMAMPENCFECRFMEREGEALFCVAHLNKITDLKKRLDTCPLEEAQEPKCGKWIFRSIKSPYRWECNKCGNKVRARYNFCPICGAKMERSEE